MVAAATGHEPTELPPLYESIDADALEALISGQAVSTDGSARVTFAYAGVEVTVRSSGEIEVRTDSVEQHRFNATPRTDSELNTLLQRLLNAASRNGISIEGGWAVRNGPELPDLDIHITRVTKPDEDTRKHF